MFRILLTTATIRSVQVVFLPLNPHKYDRIPSLKEMSAFPTTRPFQRPKVRRATTETGPNAAEGRTRTDSTRKVNENDSRDGDFGQRLLRSLLLSVHWISFYRYTFAQETHTFYGNSLKTLLYFVSDRLRWVGIKSNTIFGCICPINVIYCTVHS